MSLVIGSPLTFVFPVLDHRGWMAVLSAKNRAMACLQVELVLVHNLLSSLPLSPLPSAPTLLPQAQVEL